MNCLQCGIEFESKRPTAKFCSPKCRVTHNRSVTLTSDSVTLDDPDVTLDFKFYTISKANGMGREEDEKSAARTAKYWYDVPLGAIPIVKKDWPKMPDYMNGRQYFLWWKNEFKVEGEKAIIHNPFPPLENVRYEMGGEGSRRWGA